VINQPTSFFNLLWPANWHLPWALIASVGVQFALLLGLVYLVYTRLVKQSPSTDKLLRGLFLVFVGSVALWGVARLLQFTLLEAVFGASIQLLFIGLIVIFQPELRKLLLYLGQSDLFNLPTQKQSALKSTVSSMSAETLIGELCEAVRLLSKSKTGALIVLEPPGKTIERAYLESGSVLQASVSTELLLTIFHPNTPLHDGAVVIDSDNRLASAGVLLPLTEDPNLSWRFGTRHRAALGVSEVSACACLVVSEETGAISFVQQGQLKKLALQDEVSPVLQQFYGVNTAKAPRGNLHWAPLWSDNLGKLFAKESMNERLQGLFSRRNEVEITSAEHINNLSLEENIAKDKSSQ
jgi:diadenylate cyclase